MNTVRKWLPIVFVVFFVVFFLALPFFAGPGSMMGGGGYGWGMMGGGYPMMGFGFLMMAAVFLIPLLLIVLVAAVVISLQRNARINSETSAASTNCPHCGKQVQKDWVACPHCGKKLQAQ
jgi:predicted lipid-binding transport protein (Tim44 family)